MRIQASVKFTTQARGGCCELDTSQTCMTFLNVAYGIFHLKNDTYREYTRVSRTRPIIMIILIEVGSTI